jgi:polysaccharide biosynthesis/export protein
MFKVPKDYNLQQQAQTVEKNYIVQKNDYLKLQVYTNSGEFIIDPNSEMTKDLPTQNSSTKPTPDYLVNVNGLTKFPMIGEVNIEGLTIRQAEEILQKEYARFYQQPYVVLRYSNKRVIVLGAPGGQVLPLINENIKLVEVLALAKGLDITAKAHNIRVLRDDQVFVADFSTIDGYLKNNMIIQPGDIIYIEPLRRPLLEGLRDYAPIISLVATITTLVVLLRQN